MGKIGDSDSIDTIVVAVELSREQIFLGAVRVPPPNPDTPEGMAFILSAGGVDPRMGKTLEHDRMPLVLIQAWEAQSKLWWDLGLRYHPELASKHLEGGGQFTVAKIIDGPPPPPSPELTVENAAEKILDLVAIQNPQFAADIRRLKESGTPEERQEMLRKLGNEQQGLQNLADYIQGNM